MLRFSVTLLSALYIVSSSATLNREPPLGSIEGKLQFPDKRTFTETTRISFNHGDQQTYSGPDGNFSFFDIPPGVHVIDVYSQTYHFSQVKCQFLKEDMEHPSCIEYMYPGAAKLPIATPLVLTALAHYEYFEIKRGFSLMSILKNPMMLMMLFSVAMMYFMPKMMESLDPEEKARFKQQMAMQNDPAKMLGQLFGDGAGGRSAVESPSKANKKGNR